MEAKPGVFCFNVFDVGDDLFVVFICPPDDVSWFWLSLVFVPHRVSYQVMGDVVFLSSLDLSVFFRVRALRGHHMCHIAGELAPCYFDGSRHISILFKESVLVLRHYRVVWSTQVWRRLCDPRDDTRSYRLSVRSLYRK